MRWGSRRRTRAGRSRGRSYCGIAKTDWTMGLGIGNIFTLAHSRLTAPSTLRHHPTDDGFVDGTIGVGRLGTKGGQRDGEEAFAKRKGVFAGIEDNSREWSMSQVARKPFQMVEIPRGDNPCLDLYP